MNTTNKIIQKVNLPKYGQLPPSFVYIDNCRLVYHDANGKDKMYCINHDYSDDSTQVFLTKDLKLDCLVCEREYMRAKEKGLI